MQPPQDASTRGGWVIRNSGKGPLKALLVRLSTRGTGRLGEGEGQQLRHSEQQAAGGAVRQFMLALEPAVPCWWGREYLWTAINRFETCDGIQPHSNATRLKAVTMCARHKPVESTGKQQTICTYPCRPATRVFGSSRGAAARPAGTGPSSLLLARSSTSKDEVAALDARASAYGFRLPPSWLEARVRYIRPGERARLAGTVPGERNRDQYLGSTMQIEM